MLPASIVILTFFIFLTISLFSPVLSREKRPVTDQTSVKSSPRKSVHKKISVDDLAIRNREQIESRFTPKDYNFPYKFNIFQDMITRREYNTDTDGDGKMDADDDDDDNDGFTDILERECDTDPKNKFSHPYNNRKDDPFTTDYYPDYDAFENQSKPDGKRFKAPDIKKTGKPTEQKSGNEDEQIIELTRDSALIFKGFFGLRSNRIAVMKIVTPKGKSILLRKESESFPGLRKGSVYRILKIDLENDYILFTRLPGTKNLKLRLTRNGNGK
jgi:hypothetical protein